MDIPFATLTIIGLAYIYIFFNGANDRANAIATTVATRAMPPFIAIVWSGGLNFLGAFATTRVAETIGKGIVPSEHMTQTILASGLVGAIVWLFFATKKGIPVSVTHALVGGLAGAGIAAGGIGILNPAGFVKIGLGLFLAPLLGFIGAVVLMALFIVVFRNVSMRKLNRGARIGQILSGGAVSFTHGMNDTQNGMGVIAAALLAAGITSEFQVPLWVIATSGLVMGFGTLIAGWGVMHTLGKRLARLEPIHGVAAETNTAIVLFAKSMLGIPASTTHVITTAIMGAGVMGLAGGINWFEFVKIIISWLFTFIAAGAIAWAAVMFFNVF